MQMQRAAADRVYKGPIDCIRQITRSQGVLGLWTGFTGSLAFRSNFLWMFFSFEVRILFLSLTVIVSSPTVKALMRGFSHLEGTKYEVR